MKKLLILFLSLFSLNSNIYAGSSDDYYRDALMNGNQAFNNGNLERALFLWEICANQYNPSKYQATCRENISYVISITKVKKTEVKSKVITSNDDEFDDMKSNLEPKADIIISGGVALDPS
tara:strand:- start:353 stop:715 length:363 start_codon:yes stop_codon:yes gene_type:complete